MNMTQKNKLRTGRKVRNIVLAFLLGFCGVAAYFLLVRAGFLPPQSAWSSLRCLPSCSPEASVHPRPQGEKLLNNSRSLQTLLKGKPALEKISILVEKSEYRLTVYYDLKPIKSYPIVLGGNPRGDKRHEGDQKTPEGIYRIRDLYPHPDWSKFMWIDYPTSQSWQKHFQSKLAGETNWLLPIGGDVGIHGVPEGAYDLVDQKSNWTWGCVSLKNADVDEIYEVVKAGTLVEIVP
jgi:murein L,D-transpeptidase YafK